MTPMQNLTAAELSHASFVKHRLIPDLIESGSEATADDFKQYVSLVERLIDRPLTLNDWQ